MANGHEARRFRGRRSATEECSDQSRERHCVLNQECVTGVAVYLELRVPDPAVEQARGGYRDVLIERARADQRRRLDASQPFLVAATWRVPTVLRVYLAAARLGREDLAAAAGLSEQPPYP